MSVARDEDGRAAAVRHAEIGAAGWQAAVDAQRHAQTDHADVYALLGDVVGTLRSLDTLADRLRGQLAGYAEDVEAGRTHYGRTGRVYDDTRGEVEPGVRLAGAVSYLADVALALGHAKRSADRAWSEVGHIGVDLDEPGVTDS